VRFALLGNENIPTESLTEVQAVLAVSFCLPIAKQEQKGYLTGTWQGMQDETFLVLQTDTQRNWPVVFSTYKR
jgi:hypothetical protein